MKAKIYIKYKDGILDPQGTVTKSALNSLGINNIKSMTIGKFIEIDFKGLKKEDAKKVTDESCKKLLVNPNTETYGAAFGLAIGNGGASTNAADLYFSTATNGSLTQKFWIKSDGKIGIGVSAPEGLLHIEASSSGSSYTADAADTLILERNGGCVIDFRTPEANDSGLVFSDNVARAQGSILYNHNGNSLAFATAGHERVRITTDGHLNIGKGNESAAVENLIEMYVGGANGSHATIRGKYNRTNQFNRSEVRFGVEDNSAGKGFLAFATGTNSASEKLRIRPTGQVEFKNGSFSDNVN